ncbi:MAG: N-6 DNA methylase, partial [Microbacteriaceae bacterium]|nr:N-6 DNA methylase [Microbacteriaceae bacterium]
HYTSEENILRVIKPLFLDDLYAEFETARAARSSAQALEAFHDKLARLTFLDPACGSGNFLIVAYRELRRLELKVIEAKAKHSTIVVLESDLRVRVEQFYGIEIDEFPVQIARTAMWLTDHQMNIEAGRKIGHEYSRLPLTEGAHIVHANALTIEWSNVVRPENLDFIFGNPPFLGSRTMDKGQKADLRAVARGFPQAGFLDFVTAWYILADRMMQQNPAIEAAFVSTNSISQGEQPGILWPKLYAHGNHITFAHRTFRWMNAARGVAAVHCVIVGFARIPRSPALLFDYPDIAGEPVLDLVEAISPYLIPGGEFVVSNRQEQIKGATRMSFGNMPADSGHLLLTRGERDDLIRTEPEAEKWVKPCIGARELIQGEERFALWLEGVTPAQLRALPRVSARIAAVRDERLGSARPQLADIPHLFAQRTQDPGEGAIVLPSVSSERREYVPISMVPPGVVVTNLCLVIPAGGVDLFALLTSRMHMDWLRTVGGRLESRLRYSKDVVYNNFVMPALDDEKRATLAANGRAILEARSLYPDSTLADLYDPTTMPVELRRAHMANDEYVDRLYSAGGFSAADERVAYLLGLVQEIDAK